MANTDLATLVELTDAELDAVAAGRQNKQEGLVNVAVFDVNVNVAAQALTANSGQVFTPVNE